ncbi:hypothetical protein IMCC12053_1886 [Celeribacter marinus]|uniref:Uncharacterized protein n=1 Tax=Celeribacter marinus TaxID=1397108 RepID=A0A0P0ABY6_9RHOB|nr:hypothetical protein IMCC12053_1886 [Celeribacter marinus]
MASALLPDESPTMVRRKSDRLFAGAMPQISIIEYRLMLVV